MPGSPGSLLIPPVATGILSICSLHGVFVTFQRREAVEYVLRLAKSPDRRHKALAAKSLPTYYERAPDRREELHEAIYDLCEDSEPEVRAVALKTPGLFESNEIPARYFGTLYIISDSL